LIEKPQIITYDKQKKNKITEKTGVISESERKKANKTKQIFWQGLLPSGL